MCADRLVRLRSRRSSGNEGVGRNEVLSNAVRTTRAPDHKKMFFYDNWRWLLPSSLASARRDTVFGDRLKRTELWAKYGRPMSLWTLEFLDAQVEMDYQKDATRRVKRWVRTALVGGCAVNIITMVHRAVRVFKAVRHEEDWCKDARCDLFWSACDCMTSSMLYGAQICHIRFDTDFVLRYFQDMLLFWSLLQACATLFWTYLAAQVNITREPETVMSLLLITLMLYKNFRGVYFLILNIIVIFGYMLMCLANREDKSVQSFVEDHELLVLTSLGLTGVCYHLELSQRKDFVQASASWRESIRTELLLHNILPVTIINQLKEHKGAISESYDQVTIFFADVVSFTTMSAQITPADLVELLNRMFRYIDQLADDNGIEKVKTIGDCYMAAAGLPVENPMHAQAMARFGLQMLSMMRMGHLKNPATGQPLQVRIGIHSGPCVAGVIGHKKFAYDIWGDAVNTAARMESHGEPMKLHCSGDTHTLLANDFICESREPMTVKGKGLMQTFFVVAEHPAAKHRSFVAETSATNTSSSPSTPTIRMQRSTF